MITLGIFDTLRPLYQKPPSVTAAQGDRISPWNFSIFLEVLLMVLSEAFAFHHCKRSDVPASCPPSAQVISVPGNIWAGLRMHPLVSSCLTSCWWNSKHAVMVTDGSPGLSAATASAPGAKRAYLPSLIWNFAAKNEAHALNEIQGKRKLCTHQAFVFPGRNVGKYYIFTQTWWIESLKWSWIFWWIYFFPYTLPHKCKATFM